jgi:hypothetical protein
MFLLGVVLLPLVCCAALFGCECGPPGHASKYVKHASIVFVGKVLFTDDDGSGTFAQKTLVHFEVEEAYKGLERSVRDVWIDPGSCTTCYAEYAVGRRYLIFGYGGEQLPPDTHAMSASHQCKSKPLPSQIDLKNLPTVYAAPECSGTREITAETERSIAHELRYLKKFRGTNTVDTDVP